MSATEMGGLPIDGERTTGQDVRTQNVTAALAVSNIVKSSLGPLGLDKMLVDDIGEVTITNDGATILKRLDVEHPAGKVLVQLSDLQDQEVGDGTTSVVILAAELLRRANELVKQKIHPTSVIAGYRLAMKRALKFIKEHQALPMKDMSGDALAAIAKTSMSSKIIGSESDYFAKLVVDAVRSVEAKRADGSMYYPIKSITILKAHGRSMLESELVNGFALNCVRASQQMPRHVEGAKIAMVDFNLQKHRLQLGIQVTVTDPKELDAIHLEEANITKKRIQTILDAGANVVLTTKGIDDLCMKYFVEAGVIAVRRCKKDDLNRIAKATGGKVLLQMASFEHEDGDEAFDQSALGHAESVSEERVGDNEMIYIRGTATSRATTIVCRGANEHFLDEVHRSLHDSICVVKRALESTMVVPGGGAVEAALSIYLEDYATTLGSREQLAIAEFAESLLVIPKTLAVNAAKDASELCAKLRSQHSRAQHGEEADRIKYRYSGLNLVEGVVQDSVENGVIEPAISKVKSIRFATEAAITVLRIDDMVKLNPPQQQQ